jgi:hypothetical protein
MSATTDNREEEIKLAAREHAEEAIAALREVMNDGDEKGAARVAAAKTMLERGFGAPERKISQTVDHTIHDHRQAHFNALKLLAARRPALAGSHMDIQDAEYVETPRT